MSLLALKSEICAKKSKDFVQILKVFNFLDFHLKAFTPRRKAVKAAQKSKKLLR